LAVSQTTRLGVYQWTSGDDPFTRQQMTDSMSTLEARAGVFLSGTLAARPAAGASNNRGFYLATDTNVLFYSNGSTWTEINNYGTPSATLTPGDSASGGSSTALARADHRHPMLPFAATTSGVASTAAGGSANTYARGDHVHSLNDATVTTAKLVDSSVTSAKIASNAVTTVKVGDAQITTAKIADGAITGVKLATALSLGTIIVTTSAARPSSPQVGTSIYETDTGRLLFYDSTLAWSTPFGINAVTNSMIESVDAAKITTGTINASRIPNLDAAKITTGTFSTSRIPDLDAAKITTGAFGDARIPSLDAAKIASGTFNVARIPSLPASQVSSGTFDAARIPSLPATQITSGTFSTSRIPDLDAAKITTGSFPASVIPNLDAAKITTGTFSDARIPTLSPSKISTSSGAFAESLIPTLSPSKISTSLGAFNVALIPSLDASKIATGTFATARIPSLPASQITSGTFDAARIPSLDATKITTGTISRPVNTTGNINGATITATGQSIGSQMYGTRSSTSNDWSDSQVIADGISGSRASVAIRLSTAALQLVLQSSAVTECRLLAFNGVDYQFFRAQGFLTSSSATYKQDIATWDPSLYRVVTSAGTTAVAVPSTAMERINRVRAVTFRNTDSQLMVGTGDDRRMHDCGVDCEHSAENPCDAIRNHRKPRLGFIAEELGGEFAELAGFEGDRPMSLDSLGISAVHHAALQELDARLRAVETQLNEA
jgi:hypothetical protein